ncbi:MAG: histidinol-phosphatase [Deltaproteobacteria bacterium]|nr:histidinol-phosphatase [Deltaproteobacteria bacterium]MBW2662472.1 histidinol-phosphatase [Deltaproteobacteria bacterium]
MIDYHVHTMLCNHAKNSMEAYIQKAIVIGLKEICFLDHLTMHKSGETLSMSPGEVPFYFQAARVLKQKYKNVIKVKVGLEIDFSPAHIDIFHDITETYSFDVIGSSLHFPGDLDIVRHSSDWRHGRLDADYVYGLYLSQLEIMLDYNYFDVVCHIDLIKKFNRKPAISFEKKFDKILSKIKKKDLTVEVNTSGYNYAIGDAFPSLNILKKCHESGISITLGSDAHSPAGVGQHYDRALNMLLSAGYNHLSTFTNRKRGAISLNNAKNLFGRPKESKKHHESTKK